MSDIQPVPPEQVFAVIGHDGFKRLLAAFYQRVETDEILRPMYPEGDLAPAERRLRLFLEQYFGGPTTYSQERGHPRLRMRHALFTIDQTARDRWMQLMNEALDDVELPPEVLPTLREYFERGASFLINSYTPHNP